MMMKQFKFEEGDDNASTIIVEFFNDQYEEEMAAAKSLMEAIARIADLLVDSNPKVLPEHPTSLLICFTGAADHIPNEVHHSQPEHELRFWKDFKIVVENQPSELLSQLVRIFNPTFIQSSSSETMGSRVRAFMRDSGQFLGSSITIPSRKLHSLMAERVVDGTPDARLRSQKTVRVWAEVVHNFARVLMIDLYELPLTQMSFWKSINRKDSGGQSINALGGWALTHRLQGDPDKQEVHIEADAVGALAEPELAWDELPGLDPTKLVQPELPQGVIDEMCLSSDSDRWVVGELLRNQTCQTRQTYPPPHNQSRMLHLRDDAAGQLGDALNTQGQRGQADGRCDEPVQVDRQAHGGDVCLEQRGEHILRIGAALIDIRDEQVDAGPDDP